MCLPGFMIRCSQKGKLKDSYGAPAMRCTWYVSARELKQCALVLVQLTATQTFLERRWHSRRASAGKLRSAGADLACICCVTHCCGNVCCIAASG